MLLRTRTHFYIKRRSKSRKIAFILASVLIVACLVAGMLITKNTYDSSFTRTEAAAHSPYLTYGDIKGYPRTPISFASGKNVLYGNIYGEENNKGLIVIAHGLGGSAESYLAETMNFVDNGWRVFTYDSTGTLSSSGKSTVGLAQSAIDLDAALNYIEAQNLDLPILLYGHSWGGFAVTAVLNYDHDISAVVSVSGYNTPMQMLNEQTHRMVGWLSPLVYPFGWAYQRLLFGSAAGLSAVKGINKSNVPVLIIHGTKDPIVSFDGASIIAQKNKISNPNAVFIARDTPNHNGHNNLFTSVDAGVYTAQVSAEYETLYYNYQGVIPDDVSREFFKSVDKNLVSELDPVSMSEVNSFFNDSIGR